RQGTEGIRPLAGGRERPADRRASHRHATRKHRNQSMIAEIGHYALVLALALALAQSVLPMIGAQRGIRPWMAFARPAAFAQLGFVGLAFLALITCFLRSDFSVATVYHYSHTLQPTIYKIAAAWGNHEGSLLLWVLILAIFGALVALLGENLPPRLK